MFLLLEKWLSVKQAIYLVCTDVLMLCKKFDWMFWGYTDHSVMEALALALAKFSLLAKRSACPAQILYLCLW